MTNFQTKTNDTFTTTDGQIIRYEDIFDGIAAYVRVFAATRGRKMRDEDLEDLFQTACLKAIKYHGSYDPRYANPKTYGSRIAENCANDTLRAYIRQRDVFSDMEKTNKRGQTFDIGETTLYCGAQFETDAEVLTNEAESYIEQKKGSLNENYRYVLDLHDLGLTPKEMAEEIGCTPGAAATLLCRARKALAKSLGRQFLSDYGLCA